MHDLLPLASTSAGILRAAADGSSGPSSTDLVTAWGTVGAAVATFLAVVVALVVAIWGDWLKSLTNRPSLTLSIDMHAPDCIKIMSRGEALVNIIGRELRGALIHQVRRTVTIHVEYPTYYLRLAIGNEGNTAAVNVVTRAVELWRRNDKGAALLKGRRRGVPVQAAYRASAALARCS